MMQQTHLTAWQEHAPWPKQSHLEQDLRLCRGVAAIFADPVLAEHVAMRGGTVLHKAHLAPAARYSEDIDLVLVKPMKSDDLAEHLRRALAPVLGTPSNPGFTDAWLAVRNRLRPSRILTTKFSFVPLGLKRAETIKVDVNLDEHASMYPLVEVAIDLLDEDGGLQSARVVSYDLDEMMGTKMRALMQRKQGRDLFDLWHTWDQSRQGLAKHPFDAKRAVQAFEWYLDLEKTSMGIEEANKFLSVRMEDKKFLVDMGPILRSDLSYDVRQAETVIRQQFLSLLSRP